VRVISIDGEEFMKDNVLHLGVISTADIAVTRVIPALKKTRLVKVEAIASRNIEKAKKWAKKLEIDSYFGSYEAMLDYSGIDAVYIPLPNSLHCEWTIKALLSGKHVICEKPLSMTDEESRKMIKTAREHKLVLMEAFMYRYHPRHLKVFQLAKDGEIGDIKTIESSFSYVIDDPDNCLLKRELGGGGLYDVGCYCVNVSRMITGLEPYEVFGTYNLTRSKVDETFIGIIRFPGNIISSFQVSMDEESRYSYRVIGNRGLIEVPWAFVSFEKPTQIVIQKNEKQTMISFEKADEYVLEFEDFANAVINGKPLKYDIEDSINNIYVLDKLMESAKGQRPLKV